MGEGESDGKKSLEKLKELIQEAEDLHYEEQHPEIAGALDTPVTARQVNFGEFGDQKQAALKNSEKLINGVNPENVTFSYNQDKKTGGIGKKVTSEKKNVTNPLNLQLFEVLGGGGPTDEYINPELDPSSDFGDFGDFVKYQKKSGKNTLDDVFSEIFSPLIALYGEEHEIAKKLIMYSILSHNLKSNFLHPIDHDIRISSHFCLKPGQGKLELKKSIHFSQVGPDNFVEPTSSHSEQFVGKNSWDPKTKTLLKVPGYLQADILIVDEAKNIWVKERHEDTRMYIRKALDPIGYNEITKGGVNLPEEHRIRFHPQCVAVTFFQPGKYPDSLIEEGDLRRGICLTYDIDADTRLKGLAQKLTKQSKMSRAERLQKIEQWKQFLLQLRSQTFQWDIGNIGNSVQQLVAQIHHDSMYRGVKAMAVANMMIYDCAYQLVRMSCVRAACDGTGTPTKLHLKAAAKDYSKMWRMFLDFVVTYLPCNFVVAGPNITPVLLERIQNVVVWMASKGAVSPELSTLTTQDVLKYLVDEKRWWTSKVGGGGAYNLMRTMMEQGYIEYRREAHCNRLWVRLDKIHFGLGGPAQKDMMFP
jgi:hypothetical protein